MSVTIRRDTRDVDARSRIQARAGHLPLEVGQGWQVDFAALVRRLLLFDEVLIHSAHLAEIPQLSEAWGVGGTIDLLGSGSVRIIWEVKTVGQVAQYRGHPPGHYQLAGVDLVDPEVSLAERLREFDRLRLNRRQIRRLRTEVESTILLPPDDQSLDHVAHTNDEIEGNGSSLSAAVSRVLQRVHGVEADPQRIRIEMTRLEDDVFTADSNLETEFGLSPEGRDGAIGGAMLQLSGINQRLQQISDYEATQTLHSDDLPMIDARLAYLVEQVLPDQFEGQFTRVLEIADIPEVDDPSTIDVEKLLKVRDSNDCRDFRTWLRNAATMSDDDIGAQLGSLRARLGTAVTGSKGTNVRFAVSTLAGMIPGFGIVAGPVASAIDKFGVERVAEGSAPIAMLQIHYPSITDG